jgi:hypothetical protein
MAEHPVTSLIAQVITATCTTSCRSPLRPGRAQCTHTGPQAKPLLPLVQSAGGAGNAIGEHRVSLVSPTHWTRCSTSPSLAGVPWASGPHLPQDSATLRLPPGLLRVLRLSLVPRYLACSSRSWCPLRLVVWSERPDRARAFGRPVPHSGMGVKETEGSPTFPSSPCADLPRSQTPVVSSMRAKTQALW